MKGYRCRRIGFIIPREYDVITWFHITWFGVHAWCARSGAVRYVTVRVWNHLGVLWCGMTLETWRISIIFKNTHFEDWRKSPSCQILYQHCLPLLLTLCVNLYRPVFVSDWNAWALEHLRRCNIGVVHNKTTLLPVRYYDWIPWSITNTTVRAASVFVTHVFERESTTPSDPGNLSIFARPHSG